MKRIIEHNMNMIDSHLSLDRLKRQIAALAPSAWDGQQARISFGLDILDARLEGGLARGAVHEIIPHATGDATTAIAFALMLATRASPAKASILWIATDAQLRRDGLPYGPGLVELGMSADQIMMVAAPDVPACLKAAGDAIGCTAVAALIVDAGDTPRLDLTISRRLALAAERSGVTAFLLRAGHGPIASAAASRWQVAAAPSTPLPSQAPGRPCLALSLVRHRGGARPFDMVVEWNNDDRSFCEPTLLRNLLPIVERRQMVA